METNDVTILPLEPPLPPRIGEKHMAIDVSTLSDAPSALVAALAWVVFDPKDTGGCHDTWFKTIDWDQRERTYNWPKIQQWMMKSGMARKSIIDLTQPVPLLAAATSVAEAFVKHNCKAIWAPRKVLNTVEDAMRYSKKDPPWAPSQARDLVSCWATGMEMGAVSDISRGVTEPEDVPIGNAAFICRAVRHLYQAKGAMPADEQTM